jgi:hypothetical protein
MLYFKQNQVVNRFADWCGVKRKKYLFGLFVESDEKLAERSAVKVITDLLTKAPFGYAVVEKIFNADKLVNVDSVSIDEAYARIVGK